MKKIVKIQAILLFLLGLTLQAPAQSVNLTPWPKTMTTKSGEFVLPQTITIDVSELSDDVVAEANDFAATLRAATGRSVTVGNAENAAIKLQMNASTLDEEGYILVVAEDGITLKASTVKGFFYGLQSIKKMLPGNVLVEKLDVNATYAIPCVTINDAPRFAYRGFMLDVSRHFFTVEEIKKMLRIMAYYKMNFFHWHLTDDQGWRVEVKKYPKLTTVAATRANSYNTDLKYGQYWTNEQYGPYFYTQDEIRDVVAYAEKLHITVIPEIEMPGHLAAAMTAYPEFSCTPNGSHNVWVSGGISQDVLNVANDRAVQFAMDILTVFAPLFPSEIFHVGGDEVPNGAWAGSPSCKRLMEEQGMTSLDQLTDYFVSRVLDIAEARGVKIAGWQELAQHLAPQTLARLQKNLYFVNMWRNSRGTDELPYKFANEGTNVVLSSSSNLYYDLAYNYGKLERGHSWAGFLDERRGFSYLPYSVYKSVRWDDYCRMTDISKAGAGKATLNKGAEAHVLGVSGQLWSETIRSFDHVTYYLFPKAAPMFERGWNAHPSWEGTTASDDPAFVEDFNQFFNIIVNHEYPYYEAEGISYHRHVAQ